ATTDTAPAAAAMAALTGTASSATVPASGPDASPVLRAEATDIEPADVSAQPTPEPAAAPVISDDSLASFFQMITSFSRSVSASFSMNSNGLSYSYKHSETFKLELLKAVLTTVAPAESAAAAESATQLIDAMTDGAGASEA
ncbi:MAG: hypothetical protein WBM54_08870, partial [Woeseia sp.]